MQGVQTHSAFLVPSDVPPDTPWNTERGWDPEPEAGGPGDGGELLPERVLSDHRPLVVDFEIAMSPGPSSRRTPTENTSM